MLALHANLSKGRGRNKGTHRSGWSMADHSCRASLLMMNSCRFDRSYTFST